MKAKNELRYYFFICMPQHLWLHSFSLSVYKFVRRLVCCYQIRNVQLHGGGGGYIVCLFLFDLILFVPSTIFQLNRDGPSWVEP